MQPRELVETVIRTVPDVAEVAHRLDEQPDRSVAHAIERPQRHTTRAIIGAPAEDLPPELRDPARAGRERALEGARRAAHKIRDAGADADLAPDEVAGAEAIIVLFGRPAILIQDGKFFPPPTPWEKLEESRIDIEQRCASVGRIEVTGHPRYEWVGTGFMASEDILLTNRHVAKEFSRRVGRRWEFEPGMKVRVDFAEEFGSAVPREFPVTEVVAIHETLDVALLRVGKTAGRKLPPPLTLASKPAAPSKGRGVYVIGYPAADAGRNDAEVMAGIFNNIYSVKRLQPGEVLGNKKALHSHDCSTLGGNSGSCVIDLDRHEVVGLHFQGRYLEANWAVTIAKLQSDATVRKADLNFA